MAINNEIDNISPEADVVHILTQRGQTLATAESCTGGLLAKRLTDIPGASAVFPGGVVAYSPEVKAALLEVDPSLLEEKGAVSREVAIAMADGARKMLNADYGIGITGIAGPGSDITGTTPGTVFIAVSMDYERPCTIEDSAALCERLPPVADAAALCESLNLAGSREQIRSGSVSRALALLLRILKAG